MQERMKTHELSPEQVDKLFQKALVGRIVTQNPDGYPYAVPIHFVYYKEKIYIHGLSKGQKIDNINRNSKVCFEIDEMIGLMCDGIETACNTNTEFSSIIALGSARLVEDLDYKREVLNKIVDKYTPNFSGSTLPPNMVKSTTVIEINIAECTGKYYK